MVKKQILLSRILKFSKGNTSSPQVVIIKCVPEENFNYSPIHTIKLTATGKEFWEWSDVWKGVNEQE